MKYKVVNPRLSKKERNLIKGAIRRVFSRSELRRMALELSVDKTYTDNTRPRVKTWCRCQLCNEPQPKSYMEVDHVNPVVPIHKSFDEMSLDELVDNIWCEIKNLQSICETCHTEKTSLENKARRKLKNERSPKGHKKAST